MTETDTKPATRSTRRKQQTRTALIAAAQTCIAQGRADASILEITQAADVGVGSFYNHFANKSELFQAAVDEVLDAHGALLDETTKSLDDPAEVFAANFRITGRLFRLHPQKNQVLLHNGLASISSDRGLAPRAARDIAAAVQAGRFRVADPELAMVVAAGSLMGLSQLLHDRPERDDGEATDQIAENLLRAFGLAEDEAHEVCTRPLPNIDKFLPW